MDTAEHCVVVGAGLAGLHTVRALRTGGYRGRLSLIGAEPYPPYDRPPLTKEVLRGDRDDTTLPADFAGWDVECRLGCRATALLADAVETDAGPVPADRVVIATGASPIRLPGVAAQRSLRTIDDARAVRAAIDDRRRLVIVGAGWIGAELATAAAGAGCRVTVVEAAPTPLATALPAEVGRVVVRWYAAAGIDLRLGTSVQSVEADGVALHDGDFIEADEVVVAVGVRPEIGWLAGSGLDLTGGAVRVKADLEARSGVYAVGDVAAWWSDRYQTHMRVEHWDHALASATAVASAIMGESVSYDPVPYVWSEQFGRMVQYAGRAGPQDTLVWRGDPGGNEPWSACWIGSDRQLTAVFAVDRPRDVAQGRRLAADSTPLDATRVADAHIPMKEAVA